jgi:predicted AlkP superfamily phosphohydrolase/phosphomutase
LVDETKKEKRRVLIIGLDGSRLDIVRKWASEGALPNLKKLMDRGASGILTTEFPQHSMIAWASFVTATNPGKHGIYGIQLQIPGTYQMKVPNSTDIKKKTVFQILSDRGLVVGSINIPVSYPPQKVNGLMVTCWLTPPGAKCTYPQEAEKEIQKIGYKIQPSVLDKEDPQFEGDVKGTEAKRFETLRWFMDNYDWDLAAMLVVGTEHMHHAYAAFIDKEHPDYREGDEKIAKDYYSFIDAQVGDALGYVKSKYGDTVDVFVISDHGFGPSYGKIYLNNVLSKHGLFTEKRNLNASYRLFEFMEHSGIANRARNLLKGNMFDMLPGFVKKRIEITRAGVVEADWDKTKAYCSGILGDIRINLAGREPQGIVKPEEYESLRNEIIEKVKNDSDIGKYIAGVYKKEDIYSGPELEKIPDLLVDFKKCCTSSHKTPKGEFIGKRQDSGYHTMEGLLIADGPDIKKGEVKGAKLIDIVPTVMAIFGMKPEDYMDGKVLGMLKDAKREDRTSALAGTESKKGSGLSKQEEDLVKKRLSSLGYLE